MAIGIEKESSASDPQEDIYEKRREKRYDVPDACRQYLKLQVKNDSEFVPAVLGNFSGSGILFECPVAFSKGMRTKCILSISLLSSREISFIIEVKYCYGNNGTYIMGASIDSISDKNWFDIFVEVHDFIVLRKGSV